MVPLMSTTLAFVFVPTVHGQAHIYVGTSSGQGSNFAAPQSVDRGDRELKVMRTPHVSRTCNSSLLPNFVKVKLKLPL
jgi:hypothetical protein